MKTRCVGRVAARLFAVACLCLMIAPTAPAGAAAALEGGGSSFVQLEIEQWRSDVAKKPYSITVNYVSSGSTFGRTQFISGLVDFGMSDIPFQPEEQAQAAGRPYTYVTVSAGGVGFMYNLRDTSGKRIGFPTSAGGTGTDLKLSPANVCRVFSEPGLKWNDPAIQAENPDIALPNRNVKPVLRQDGAGTSFVTMEYCIATAPEVWAKFVDYVARTPVLETQFRGDPFLAGKPSSRWPPFAGESAFASDGVANVVANGVSGEGAMTAVEAGFAEVRGFPNALIRNAAGVYQYPEAFNVNRALAYASRNSDATVTLEYLANDPDAYFPSSYSYAIVPTTGFPADKGSSLGTFLNYAVTLGQEKADALGYAPLSLEIIAISLNEIQRIPGAPPKPVIVVGGGGGSPDPAVPTTTVPGAPTTTVPDGSTGGDGTPAPNTSPGGGGSTGPGTSTGGGGSNTSTTRSVSGATTTRVTATTPGGATATSPANRTATGATSPANRNASPASGEALSAGAGAGDTGASAPSNGDVAVALVEGAGLCGAALALARRFVWRA